MAEQKDIKVVLVGDSGIGKTCLIKRYVEGTYSSENESTTVATYSNKKLQIGGLNISLDIWDTAGQELYRALSKNFYLNASIGILVYDITRKDSYEHLKDYWFDQLKTSGEENMVLGIAGNKCDMMADSKVDQKEVSDYAKKQEAVFYLTSCKDNIGVDNIFEECAKKYIEKNDKNKTPNPKEGFSLKPDNGNKDSKNKGKKCC